MKRYRFGVYEFDRKSGELRRGGVVVSLEAQPAKALGLLLSRRGEVVTKEELKKEIWGEDTQVDFDRGLAYCLSEIRAALQDSGTNPKFVQTLPKQGYRMIAPVEEVRVSRRYLWVAGLAVGVVGVMQLRKGSGEYVVGVSIFDNETGNAEWDPWVAGLSDAVVARLANLDPAKVKVIGNAEPLRRARNIRKLKELAAELKADYVVLGQLQNEEGGLRFVTHLIRLSDGVHLKANRIRSATREVKGMEERIVGEFENAIRKHLLHAPEAGG